MKLKYILPILLLATTTPAMADSKCKDNDTNCQSHSGGFFGWISSWRSHSSDRSSHSSDRSSYSHITESHSSDSHISESHADAHGGFGGEAAGHGAGGE